MKLTDQFSFTQLKLKDTKQNTCYLRGHANSNVYKRTSSKYFMSGSSLARISVIILTFVSVNILAGIYFSKWQFFLPYYSNSKGLASSLNVSRQVWLKQNKSLSKRLTALTVLLTEARDKILSRSEAIIWPTKAGVIYSNPKSFLREFSNRSDFQATTIYLQYLGTLTNGNATVDQNDVARNFIITQYYHWSGMPTFCQWLQTEKHRYLLTQPCENENIIPAKYFTKHLVGNVL